MTGLDDGSAIEPLGPPRPRRRGPDWVRALRDPVWVDAILPTILLRGVILVFAVLAVVVFRPEALPGGSLLGIWERWDAPHYLEIARYG